MLTNSMPRYEPLSDEALATIHAGWKRLGQEVGVQFDNEEALQLFRDAGQTVDDDGTVRFDADFLLTQAAKAPAEFEMIARNRERDLVVGGDHMTFCAVQGPPFVRIGDERREGTYADYENLLRLVQMDPNLDTPGRNVLEPNDLPLDSRHLLRALSSIRLTDRVWAGEPSSGEAAADCLRMAEIVHGTEVMAGDAPVIFANCNVNSPLRFDARMLDGILNYGAARQAIIITPFLLMGAMAPVSTPAALVQQTLESLAGVALEAPATITPASEVQLKNWMSRAAMDHFQVVVATPATAAESLRAAIAELSETYQGDRRWRTEPTPAASEIPNPFAEMAASLDRIAVLRHYTIEAAQSAFAEARLGRLTPGARADFVLIDADIELATASELRTTHVLETWIGGRKVWSAQSAEPKPPPEGR